QNERLRHFSVSSLSAKPAVKAWPATPKTHRRNKPPITFINYPDNHSCAITERMKPNWIAPLVIFGNLALLTLPIIGVVILWVYLNHNEPLIADYLVVLAPIGWLLWALCKQRQWHETDSKVLRACSALNTAIIFIGIIAFLIYLFRACAKLQIKTPGD